MPRLNYARSGSAPPAEFVPIIDQRIAAYGERAAAALPLFGDGEPDEGELENLAARERVDRSRRRCRNTT